jgi:hypothetical protein
LVISGCDLEDKKQTQEPPRKKSKLLGNIDENSVLLRVSFRQVYTSSSLLRDSFRQVSL